MPTNTSQKKEASQKPRLRDYVKQLMKLKAKSGPGLFGQARPTANIPLDPSDAPSLVESAVNNLSLNEKQKELLRKVVAHWLTLVPGGAHSNQVRELVNFTQLGNATVPGYKPEPDQKRSLDMK